MTGDPHGLAIARMIGACAAAAGEAAVSDCPADRSRRWRKAWAIGFARSCISRFRKELKGFGLAHVKPCRPGPRADWTEPETDFLMFTYRRLPATALSRVLGRPANAIRVKACRLGLAGKATR